MSKFVALLSLLALVIHGLMVQNATIGTATTGLVLAVLFGTCAMPVVKEWLADLVGA